MDSSISGNTNPEVKSMDRIALQFQSTSTERKKTESQQPGINIGHKRTILFSNQKRILVDPSFVASTVTVG